MQEDSAIVIGLQNYPGIGQPSLSGPETDAKDFTKWLLSRNGGDLPKTNIKLILSSDYPPATNASNCKPVFGDIKDAFDTLRRRSIKKENAHLGPKIGRRLYIFMSGHGITPTPYGQISKEVGLLLGNVDDVNIMDTDTHFPGCFIADWFSVNGCFDEVFLFMDCCRDIIKIPQSSVVFVSHGNVNNTIRFYAFATKLGRRAKERKINGKMRGVFTRTLLQGLKGAAADMNPNNPNMGIITGASLKSFLINNTKNMVDANSLGIGDDPEPEIDIIPNANNGADIFIKGQVPLQRFPAILSIQTQVTGTIEVITSNVQPVHMLPANGGNLIVSINLPRGVFCLQAVYNGAIKRSKAFQIYGVEKLGCEVKYNLIV